MQIKFQFDLTLSLSPELLAVNRAPHFHKAHDLFSSHSGSIEHHAVVVRASEPERDTSLLIALQVIELKTRGHHDLPQVLRF